MTTETRNQHTGIVPTDRSWDASNARHKVMRTSCPASDTAVARPERPHNIPQADLVDFLRTIVDGKDASFAQSLVAYFDRNGALTSGQDFYARKVYGKWYCVLESDFIKARQHDWVEVGEALHYANHVLGTYSSSTYWSCTKCKQVGETSKSNNYSGD